MGLTVGFAVGPGVGEGVGLAVGVGSALTDTDGAEVISAAADAEATAASELKADAVGSAPEFPD